MSIFANIGQFIKTRILSHFTSKVALIVVVLACVLSLMYQYFKRDDAVSILSIAGAVVEPFQEGANTVGSFIFRTEQDRISLEDAKEQIKEQQREIADLKRSLDELNQLQVENATLRALLNAKEQYPEYEMEEALIIGNDGVNSFERFTINKGTSDGIQVNMNVINDEGLIGIVTYTGLNYSVVTSIIEEGMNVSAMTKNGHENCIVSGDLARSGNGRLLLENALSGVDLLNDGTLVTSYISDRFLPNLLIGYAVDVHENEGGLTQSGYVTTAVDFTRLSEVLVITTMHDKLLDSEGGK